MSRSFFPTCSSQKAEMEEMSKELDGLRSEAEARAAECRAKSALVDGLRREAAEQAARLREAREEVQRQAGEIAAKDQEASSAREACEDLRAKFAEKEQAFRHLCVAHDGLKASLRERGDGWDAERRGLVAALEESEVKRLEQDVAVRSCNEEVSRLKRLLSEKEKRCSEAEQRALAQREVMMRDDTLAKLEEEKAAIEGKLKWKAEQFRHLEEALKKVRDEFRDAERQWGADRSTLADQIGALETKLDSKTRVAEEFRSRLEMCSQALAHEEGRRKLLEAEMSDLRHMYGNVVSEYEEARSTIELLTSKRDGEIASLRSSLAEKSTLLNEMEYCKARLDQENEDLRSLLKEYQEAQIGGADAAGMLKGLREKFRALEQTHRSCNEKLSHKETEWKAQMGKLEDDLNGCLSQLHSKDMLIRQLQNELLSSYSSLELRTVENLEASIVCLAVEAKFYDSCSFVDTLKLNMQQRCEYFEQNIAAAKSQLEEKNLVIAQSQAEQAHQLEVMATLRGRIEQLEFMEQEHEKMQRQLGEYKEMLDNASRNVHCLKDETSEKEKSLKEELGKALSDLDEAHRDLDEQKSQLRQLEINLHQQKQAVEHLEKRKIDLETELKGYMDDNHVLKRDLDVALNAKIGAERYKDESCALKRDLVLSLVAKFEVEDTLREEKDKLSSIIDERDKIIEELQQYISVLEEDNVGQKLDVASLIKSEVKNSIQEVNNRYSEIVEIFDEKLLELETRLGFFEQKYTRREHEIMEIFDQEEADWYMLIAEKENAIADIQQIVESVQLNIKHLLDAAASKLSEVQLEVQQLYGFAENLNSLNLIQEHDSYFKDMLIEECQRELVALQMKLVLEKEQSSDLKHVLEKLRAETTAEILEKEKEHLEVVNELKHLEEKVQSFRLLMTLRYSGLLFVRESPKKRRKTTKSAESSIVPRRDEAPAATMYFPPSQSLEITTKKKGKHSQTLETTNKKNGKGCKR
ncbi:hypothetical protein ZWY2020_053919 [Hordeum vulgare]|nr:hypothetical protein ZWY2020_053919 [Hordeum vulgare]